MNPNKSINSAQLRTSPSKKHDVFNFQRSTESSENIHKGSDGVQTNESSNANIHISGNRPVTNESKFSKYSHHKVTPFMEKQRQGNIHLAYYNESGNPNKKPNRANGSLDQGSDTRKVPIFENQQSKPFIPIVSLQSLTSKHHD